MIEYQFNYFIKQAIVGSDPSSILPLIESFNNKFLPSFVDHATPVGTKKVVRMVGFDEFDGASVLFAPDAVFINILYRETNINETDELDKLSFINKAIEKINSSVKAWRVSSVITSIERATNDLSKKMYAKHFSGDEFNDFFEWSVRRAKRIDIKNESFNLITTQNRNVVMNAFNPSESFDAVVTQIDINTSQDKSAERFSFDNQNFIDISALIKEILQKEIE
ncbi:hypothetical protein [Plesiomonas shigelloides]|uniref:hypothetical protein n=1 Tax=Plesiomonas shigelloides TaxID=703 RepID=UPI003260A09B